MSRNCVRRYNFAVGLFCAFVVQVAVAQDYDGDGMPDGYEQAHWCLNWTNPDGHLDYDGDGASSLTEYQAGTDPCDNDTDNDLLMDGFEMANSGCLDPLVGGQGILDPDGDCIINYAEQNLGTSPCVAEPDFDGDGMPNCWEQAHWCLNWTNPDGHLDYDGDGLSSRAEFEFGTNPCSADVPNCNDGDDCTIDAWLGPTLGCQPIRWCQCDDTHPCPQPPPGWEYQCLFNRCQLFPNCDDDSDCLPGACCTTTGCQPCNRRERVIVPDLSPFLQSGFGFTWTLGGCEIVTMSPGFVYGDYAMPIESGLLAFEYQLENLGVAERAVVSFGDQALFLADAATAAGAWVRAVADVRTFAGQSDRLMFSLLPGATDPNPPYDVFRIRNVRLLSQCAFNPLADLNCDGVVDAADFAAFAECTLGPDTPAPPECESSALDGDDDVDMHDFAAFQREYGLP